MAWHRYEFTFYSNFVSPEAIKYDLKLQKLWHSLWFPWFCPLFFGLLLLGMFAIKGDVGAILTIIAIISFYGIMYYYTHGYKDKKCKEIDIAWIESTFNVEVINELKYHLYASQIREARGDCFLHF